MLAACGPVNGHGDATRTPRFSVFFFLATILQLATIPPQPLAPLAPLGVWLYSVISISMSSPAAPGEGLQAGIRSQSANSRGSGAHRCMLWLPRLRRDRGVLDTAAFKPAERTASALTLRVQLRCRVRASTSRLQHPRQRGSAPLPASALGPGQSDKQICEHAAARTLNLKW